MNHRNISPGSSKGRRPMTFRRVWLTRGTKHVRKTQRLPNPICSPLGFKPERISLCYLSCMQKIAKPFMFYMISVSTSGWSSPTPDPTQIEPLATRNTVGIWAEARTSSCPGSLQFRLEDPCTVDGAARQWFKPSRPIDSPQRAGGSLGEPSGTWWSQNVLGTLDEFYTCFWIKFNEPPKSLIQTKVLLDLTQSEQEEHADTRTLSLRASMHANSEAWFVCFKYITCIRTPGRWTFHGGFYLQWRCFFGRSCSEERISWVGQSTTNTWCSRSSGPESLEGQWEGVADSTNEENQSCKVFWLYVFYIMHDCSVVSIYSFLQVTFT